MLNRRHFLQVAGAAGLTAWSRRADAEADVARPNLLWLSVEDISPHLGCYGCEDAITPTLDKLAAKGVRFENAFAAAPVCAPNRSTTIAGVYAAALGSHHMRSGGEGRDGGSKPALSPEVTPFPALLREAGYYCTNNAKEDYNFATGARIWDASSRTAHWRNRPDPAQPFFAVFNYTDTHEGRVQAAPEAFARATRALADDQRRDPAQVAVPPYHADTPATRRNWANYHELITGMDYWVAEMLAQLEEDGLAENTIVMFWSDHGHGLPRGKRWLYDSGTHIPLIVHVPDRWRGHAGLEPGRPDDRLVSCVDFAPSMLNLAGVPLPAYLQGRAFLGPNQPAPRDYVFATRDRMDERYDMIRMVRDKRYKYIRNYRPDLPYTQYLNTADKSPVLQDLRRLAAAGALPPGAWWAAARTKPVEEVYDLEADPHEIRNLAEDPALAAVRARMRAAHEQAMRDNRDLGLVPEPELVRLEQAYGPRYSLYDVLEKEHPGFWTRLRRVAEAAAEPAVQGNLETLGNALESDIPACRYWAAIGLRRDPKSDPLLRRALQDPVPMVAVAAAHGLAGRDAPDIKALEVLAEGLNGPEEWVRLMAAHALDDAGEPARAVLPALQHALGDRENKYVVRVANHALNTLLETQNEVP